MGDQTIMLILGFVTAMIGLITPIVKLNSAITKLTVILDTLQKQTESNHNDLSERVKTHGEEIDDIRDKVTTLETRVAMYHKGE